MYFKTRTYGGYGYKPSTILELTVGHSSGEITEDILEFGTNKVPEYLIDNLKDLLEELEQHNESVNEFNDI